TVQGVYAFGNGEPGVFFSGFEETDPGATVTGKVFDDADGDGVQDPNEDGMSGVTVTLATADGTGSRTTTTDSAGNYKFEDVAPGAYTVSQKAPKGFTTTTAPAAVTVSGGTTTVNGGTSATRPHCIWSPPGRTPAAART